MNQSEPGVNPVSLAEPAPSATARPSQPWSKPTAGVQTTLCENEDAFHEQVSAISDGRDAELREKQELQVIEVYDWGIVERKNCKGEVERVHDFMVHADNAIVAVGIGDINEAITEVRSELEGKGYRKISIKRMPMKEGERVMDLVG